MPDSMTPAQRHYCMSRIRSGNTGPERKLRSALHAAGYRYRLYVRALPGTPDIVLAKYRTAVFVNGCFWHGHEGCRYYTRPKTHPEFWEEKVARNQERDKLAEARLEALGWHVVTIWECELKKASLEATMERLEAQLAANREAWLAHKARRKADRAFALAEDRRRRELRAALEAELAAEFAPVPPRIKRLSREEE